LNDLALLPRGRLGRISLDPAASHFLRRPRLGRVRIQPHQHVQMVVHHREPAHRNRKTPGQQFQPAFDPLLAVFKPLATQKARRTQREMQ